MQAAFKTIAQMHGHGFTYSGYGGSATGRDVLRGCGRSIKELLLSDQHVAAYNAMQRLVDNGASCLDLADFMFRCTQGVPVNVKGYLDHAGFPAAKLKQMARTCSDLANDLERLNCEDIPGPLSYLFHADKRAADDKQLQAFHKCPECLRICASVLREWPPHDFTSELTARKFGKHYLTTYFALYIIILGGDFEVLSRLLELMLAVRFKVASESEKLLRAGRAPRNLTC
jgi:hypothetical protein